MSDTQTNSPIQGELKEDSQACEAGTTCCSNDSPSELPFEKQHDGEAGHEHHESRIDGAGEPCPTPIMWQEICGNYFRESVPWEIERVAHRISGRTWGNGKPLYFLNNFAATAELNSLVSWLLRDEFRCVLFDSCSRDQRSAVKSKPTMQEFAADLFAAADSQGDDEILIFGAGFGAAVGLQAILDKPGRVTGAVLQHGFARRGLGLFERLLANICLRSNQILDKLPQRRRFQAANHLPWFPPYDNSRFDFLIESTGSLPLRDLARRAIAMHSFDITDRLKEITCPLMLLRTEGEGRLAGESQVELESKIKNSQVEWLHSAGQHPSLTHPHRVAKLVRTFFQSQPAFL